MIERVKKIYWRAALPLTRRVGRLPIGIWAAWACLAYAAGIFAQKFLIFTRPAEMHRIAVIEAVATWLLILLAAIALARRRLAARMLCGMVMALAFMHCLFRWDLVGVIVSLIPFPCLLANRRWFYERLPNIG